MKSMRTPAVAALAAVVAAGGCQLFEREAPPAPTEAEVAEYYQTHNGIREIAVNGNVVEIHVLQPRRHLERGGSLWARVGPYVYLFSPDTQDLLADHPGVAAVRARTYDAEGEEVARALLLRETMNGLLWKRSLNLLGHALQEGTERPRRLEELLAWGEEHTEHTYNPAYAPDTGSATE